MMTLRFDRTSTGDGDVAELDVAENSREGGFSGLYIPLGCVKWLATTRQQSANDFSKPTANRQLDPGDVATYPLFELDI